MNSKFVTAVLVIAFFTAAPYVFAQAPTPSGSGTNSTICASDMNCSEGKVCIAGECTLPPTSGDPLPPDSNGGGTIPDGNNQCSSDLDCKPDAGLICVNSQCVMRQDEDQNTPPTTGGGSTLPPTPCVVNANCKAEIGETCVNGECVLPPPQNLPPTATGGGRILDRDQCGYIIYNGSHEDKINIFFLAERYTDVLRFEEHIRAYLDGNSFFSIAPYSDNVNRFNVFAVFLQSQDFKCTWQSAEPVPAPATCYRDQIIPIISQLCFKSSPTPSLLDKNKSVVVAMSEDFYGRPRIAGFEEDVVAMPGTPPRIGSMIHEMGHYWGNFGEEYTDVFVPQSRRFYPFNLDSNGCSKWCSGQLNTASPCYSDWVWYQECTAQIPLPPEDHVSEWNQCFVKSFKDGRNLAMCNLGTACREDTGCYWSGESISDWRAYPEAVMRGGYLFDQKGVGYGKINADYLAAMLAGLAQDTVIIEPTVQNVKTEARGIVGNGSEAQQVKITNNGENLLLTTGSQEAIVQNAVELSNRKMFIGKESKKEVKVMTYAAQKKADGLGINFSPVPTLKVSEQEAIYSFTGKKEGKLLFVIPVSLDVEAQISAETGEVTSMNLPWWSFLVS